MNDLRSFVLLQARLYEFLARQDETTLQAIASGAGQLAVLPADDPLIPANSAPRGERPISSRPAPGGPTMVPSREPLQVVQDLSRLASADERLIYLNATELPVSGLRRVAKLSGLAGYSRLSRPDLVNLLVNHGKDRADGLADEPRTPAPASRHPASRDPVGNSEGERGAVTPEARPSTLAPSTETAQPNVKATTIASRLREIDTEEEGAAYLRAQSLDREILLAVAAELQLTRVDRLRQAELERRVLKQAIGDRRKFAGLRKW